MTGVQTCALPICFPVTIGNQGTALDVRSKELGMSKQETLNYYHGNVIGQSFTILGEMLSNINPFKFK